MTTKKIILLLTCILWACNTEDDLVDERAKAFQQSNPQVSGESGSADLSNYIAVGNSLTAGFMDGALYDNGQLNSYPMIIAEQIQAIKATGSNFDQPDIKSPLGYASGTKSGRGILSISAAAPNYSAAPDSASLVRPYQGDKKALNNFGVPGATVGQLLLPGFGSPVGNPYYARFASTPLATVIDDAVAAGPTFFTLWIGSNDVLGYATRGGTGAKPTSVADFQASFTNVLTKLKATKAKGIVLNIPPIITAPFFKAVAYNAAPISKETAAQLNSPQAFGAYNAALDGLAGANLLPAAEAKARKLTFEENPKHPILIVDSTLRDLGPLFDGLVAAGAITTAQRGTLGLLTRARFAVKEDLILLSAGTILGKSAGGNPLFVNGVSLPLDDYLVITANEELPEILTAIGSYNAVIQNVVKALDPTGNEIIYLDVQPTFADLLGLDAATARALGFPAEAQARADGKLGLLVNPDGRIGPNAVTGITLQPDFSPNGVFSVDGIHPNPRGYAIVANLIIETINAKFNATIPRANILARRAVYFQN